MTSDLARSSSVRRCSPRCLRTPSASVSFTSTTSSTVPIGFSTVCARRAVKGSSPSREWLKTKCSATGAFVVTGYRESAPGALEAVRIAELVEGKLHDAGEVRIGVGRRLLETLREIRVLCRAALGNANVTPVRPDLALQVKYFGRHRSGVIRDGVIRSINAITEGQGENDGR